MSDEQMRETIAELDGWTRHDLDESGFKCKRCGVEYKKGLWQHWEIKGQRCPKGENICSPPNYPSDLNAVHRAEMRLDINQVSIYADELEKICVPVHICPTTHWMATVMATAQQRAKALVRTIEISKECRRIANL